jgi:hypothetical protein
MYPAPDPQRGLVTKGLPPVKVFFPPLPAWPLSSVSFDLLLDFRESDECDANRIKLSQGLLI